jgi:hypothetical protein
MHNGITIGSHIGRTLLVMSIQFLRGNPQAPKGHAIFFARSTNDSRTLYCTYCVVPPIPMSLAKYLPPLFAAQLPPEELRDAVNVTGMPIPPMLEEGYSLEQLERLAEHRDDDLCDIGTINAKDEGARLQMAALSSQEYGQLYATHMATLSQSQPAAIPVESDESTPLDDMDAEDLLISTMSDRQKLAELGKLVGMARYALEGRDALLLQQTQQRMQRITRHLAEKYRGAELVTAALEPKERGAKLAELYLSRAFKLLDEEYADIPDIERAIRELRE